MSFFLLTFSRRSQEPTVVERFEDSDEAVRRLAEEEERVRGTDEGVVLLFADDEADLRRTHAHYFTTFGALREAAEEAEESLA